MWKDYSQKVLKVSNWSDHLSNKVCKVSKWLKYLTSVKNKKVSKVLK